MRKSLLALALLQVIVPIGPVFPATLPVLSVPTTVQCTEGGTASIKVTRTGSKTTTASFRYATANGTALAPADYTAASGQQSVRKNAATYTLSIKCRAENQTYQVPRSFTFSITAVSGATVGQGRTTVTVVDNEPVPPPPAAWAKCADDGGTCEFMGPADVRYGANGTYRTLSIPFATAQSLGCNASAFGGDPAPGVAKTCETTGKVTTPPPPVVNWTQCAVEGSMCAVVGTANVRYGFGTTWTAPRQVTGLIACENSIFGDPLVGVGKVCQTDGVVGTVPVEPPVVCPDGTVIKLGENCPTPPPVPTGQWVPAPLKVGGYGFVVNSGPCCNGLIVLVTRAVMSDDADPSYRHLIYYGRFVADPSGNFPGIDPANYWATKELGGWGEGPLVNGSGGLIGVAPVAIPPAVGIRPTYGDTVVALNACVGMTDPAQLVPGASYIVKGLRTTLPVGGNSTPMNLADTVVLNPVNDDGLHRGDGWWGLTVPASCVQTKA